MSKRPQEESKLWGELNRNLPLEVRATRMEVRYPAGFPDVQWWHRGRRELWGIVELKDQVRDIRREQRIFTTKARKDGVSSWILARWLDDLYLFDPTTIEINCRLDFTRSAHRLSGDGKWGNLWGILLK